MPGLLRGMARVAAISGTATAVSNRVSRRQANRWAEQEAPPAYQQPQAMASGGGGGEDRIAKLKDLADLKAQGILNDEEFASEKARILAA